MFIVEVIPLAALPPQVPQLLSYFFSKPLAKGAIVEVLIGNRKITAAVTSSTSLEGQKASLKKSDFQLKKISSVISEVPLIPDIQFKIALWLSRNYFAPLGLCLKTVLPPFFLKKDYELRLASYELKKSSQSVIPKPLVVLTKAKDAIKNIEPEVNKVLVQKKQVLIVASEISIAEYFYNYFAGYHETALVHSGLAAKKIYKAYSDIVSGDVEIIIGTRQTLFSPFHNLGLIILEDPANEAYKSDMAPRYNTSDLCKKISELYSCPLIFISQIPDINTFSLIQKGNYTFQNKKFKTEARIKLIDLTQEAKSGNFSSLSRELSSKILEYAANRKRIFIFSSRKGYTGHLLCENCGHIFECPNCSIPMKVYKAKELTLRCHRCSSIQKYPEICSNCRSYKLKNTGFAGSQKIEEELRRLLNNSNITIPIFVLDSSLIKTRKAEKDLLKKMDEAETFICIGTQMMFSHRYGIKFDLIGISSLDSLVTIPDFKSEESLFYQFTKVLDFDPEDILIQVYNPDNLVMEPLLKEAYAEFYGRELQLRKLFWYPPYARLVRTYYRHSDRQKVAYEARVLAEKLKMALIQRELDKSVKIVGPSPGFIEKERGVYIYNIVLKILPDQKIEEILRFIPSDWMIDVDPRSIL